jgi:hypothetical protein
MAATLAAEIREAGGIMTESDIRAYEPKVTEAVQTEVMGHLYVGAGGSSSGGVVVPAILKFLQSYPEPLSSIGELYTHVRRLLCVLLPSSRSLWPSRLLSQLKGCLASLQGVFALVLQPLCNRSLCKYFALA